MKETIVILAGGKGTRLGLKHLPKSLVLVNGKPFIIHQIELLKSKGFKNIVICTGYKGELIREMLKDEKGLTFYDDGNEPLGTGGAINNCIDYLTDDFFVTYGDSYLDIDYKGLMDRYKSSNVKALMTVYKEKNGNVCRKDGEVIDYSRDDCSYDYTDYGVMIINKKIFKHSKGYYSWLHSFDLGTIIIDLIRTYSIKAQIINERYQEIGTPKGLKKLRKHLCYL